MSCDANIAEETGNSLYEWLKVYKKLGAEKVNNP